MTEHFTEIVKNGITMYSVDIINRTGLAEAYFSTRLGGVSILSDCASMNLNIFKPLDIENSKINMRLFCQAINFDPSHMVTNREKHTDIVRTVDSSDILADPYDETQYSPADGLITDSRDIWLYGYNSDCSIIMLFDPIEKVISLIHSGWKGSLNGLIQNTVNTMSEQFGCKAQNLIAAVAPSIGPCCFEVDAPVAELFHNFKDFIIEPADTNGKFHIDLPQITKNILLSLGLLEGNIAVAYGCTMCDSDLYHSYRRCRGNNGVNGIFLKLT